MNRTEESGDGFVYEGATVYVGSAWHQDCDPFVTVIAMTETDCEQGLARIAEDEFTEMNRDGECGDLCSDECECSHNQPDVCLCQAINDIRDSGPQPFTMAEVRASVIGPSDWPEKLSDLLRDGIVYV